MNLAQDFVDLLAAFDRASVRALVIGGYAVGAHGRPRATKDLDVLLEPLTRDTRERACRALADFGAPPSVVESLRSSNQEDIIWFGSPPLRIDLLRSVTGGLDFEQAWTRRLRIVSQGQEVHVVGLEDLLTLKRAAGRPQDLADVHALTTSSS